MFDFSDDETIFMLVAAVVTIWLAVVYVLPIDGVYSPRLPMRRRLLLGFWPIVCLMPTLIVLQRWADPQVVGHLDYELLFLVGAAAWVFAAARMMPLLGVSIRGDAIERANAPAALAAMAWMLAVGIVYACANIGAGPTIWTTLAPAFVGTFVLAVLMAIAGLAEAITIERDGTAGALFGIQALILAGILGFAAAGDWISWPDTWSSFLSRGWPAIAVAVAFGIANRLRGVAR